MTTKFDEELIRLYVAHYSDEIEGMIPDLADCCDDLSELRPAIEGYAADYIHDREYRGEVIPEIREAAKRIAKLYA